VFAYYVDGVNFV